MNRLLWTVIGLVVAGVGVLGLLFDLAPNFRRFLEQWRSWGDWALAGVTVAGLPRTCRNRPGISRASAHLSGDRQRPRLQLWLTIDPGTNLRRAQEWVDASVRRFSDTTDLSPASLSVDTRISHGSVGRVA